MCGGDCVVVLVGVVEVVVVVVVEIVVALLVVEGEGEELKPVKEDRGSKISSNFCCRLSNNWHQILWEGKGR